MRSASSTPQIFRSAEKSRRARRSRLSTSARMAGSKRSRAASWSARHSARLRAKMPGGSKSWQVFRTASTAGSSTPSRRAISDASPRMYPASSSISDSSPAMRRDAGSVKPKAICSAVWSRNVATAAATASRSKLSEAPPDPRADFHCAERSGSSRSLVPGSSGKIFSSEASSVSDIASALLGFSVSANQSLSSWPEGSMVGIRDFVFPGLCAFEQRVSFDFLVDKVLELDMGELQKPDRLQQLRRHHQRLRLA